MTAVTSQKLADLLRAAGFEDLAVRAERDEFHDFLSHDPLPDTTLDKELAAIVRDSRRHPAERLKAADIRNLHWKGAFDASKEESDAWAISPEGQAAYAMLIGELIKDGKP
jgi:hypothetical protein